MGYKRVVPVGVARDVSPAQQVPKGFFFAVWQTFVRPGLLSVLGQPGQTTDKILERK